MFTHFLLPTDGSPLAHKAAQAGIELAHALSAKVTAYYAIEPLHMLYDEGYSMDEKMLDGIEDVARAAGQKHIDSIGEIARASGVAFDSVMTKAPTAYEGIIETARERKCDVICIASHGRRGLSRLIMGSVTQKVLAHSEIPVVVYR